MFKRCRHIVLLICLPLLCLSQNGQLGDSLRSKTIASLRQNVLLAKGDSNRIIAMQNIAFFYQTLNVDSSLKYFNAALNLSMQKSYAWAEARIMAGVSGLMQHQGKYTEAFELLFKSLKIAEDNNIPYDIARANRRLSGVYFELENYGKAIAYLLKALQIDKINHLEDKVAIDHYALGDEYEKISELDSAAFHINSAFEHKELIKGLIQYVYEINGHIQQKRTNYKQALSSYRKGLEEANRNSDLIASSQICADISSLNKELNEKDSAILYALKGFDYGQDMLFKKGIMLNGNLLAELYDSIQPSLALKYYRMASAAKDSLFGMNNIQAIQNLLKGEEAKQRDLEEAKLAYQNKLKLYGLLTGLAVLLIISFIFFRNNRQKQKANVLLQQQKEKIGTTLNELQSTQAQLIQSEKMASLGELTAGIAHEIQNPLNFVNNFSEVNKELIEELKSEKVKAESERDEQLEMDLLNDIQSNSEKINAHGKRADAIVKGMLQHSRKDTGIKEPTDINALCDEYLRLSYHGLRAKDKSFNADFKTYFDGSIGKINIVPQDFGRVLLNLFNNAFYSVESAQPLKGSEYKPLVSVTTSRLGLPSGGRGGTIEIIVADNGNGIPQNIIDKIFQPFFTTKPTGSGTGLGLSLAFDIITKEHNGTIKVESKEGEGSMFIIQLTIIYNEKTAY